MQEQLHAVGLAEGVRPVAQVCVGEALVQHSQVAQARDAQHDSCETAGWAGEREEG